MRQIGAGDGTSEAVEEVLNEKGRYVTPQDPAQERETEV
jgi:hypothetical protein